MKPLIAFLVALLMIASISDVHANSNCGQDRSSAPYIRNTSTALIACGKPLPLDPQPLKFSSSRQEMQVPDEFHQIMKLSDRVKIVPIKDAQSIPALPSTSWLIIDRARQRAFSVAFDPHHPSIIVSAYELSFVSGADITMSIAKGKKIQLEHAYIDGPMDLSNQKSNLRNPIYITESVFGDYLTVRGGFSETTKFLENIDFSSSTFLGPVRIRNVEFSKEILFKKTYFSKPISIYRSRFPGNADFSFSTFDGKAEFLETVFRDAVFRYSTFGGDAGFYRGTVFRRAVFTNTKFKARSQFENVIFYNTADFGRAIFEGDALFSNTRFSKESNFDNSIFLRQADFSKAMFWGEASFVAVRMSGNEINFTSATFKKDARFTLATFFNDEQMSKVFFRGTQFSARADFSYSEFQDVDFSSYIPDQKKRLFHIEPKFQEILDVGKISKELKIEFRKTIQLSSRLKVLLVEKSNKWIVIDKDFRQTFAIFNDKDQLDIYFKTRGTWIDTFDLIGCSYQKMNISPLNIGKFAFGDESTFDLFILNQKRLGRQAHEYDNVTLACKRFQRDQKWFLTKWVEKIFWDWTTQYGTAKVPWGLLIYAVLCVSGFTAIYISNRDFLAFVGNEKCGNACPKRPNNWQILWFSLNTFTPVIEFFNASNWQPKDDTKFFAQSVIATIERILGWAMIPALLSYF